MSISLNDHENRIKALEAVKLSDSYLRYPEFKSSHMSYMSTNKYTVPENGWLFIGLTTNNQTTILINDCNTSLYNYGKKNEWDDNNGTFIPVKANDYVRTNNGQSVNMIMFKMSRGGGINLGTLLKRFLVYIKLYSKLFHLQFLEVK